MWSHDHEHFVTGIGVLAVMSVACLVTSVVVLGRPGRSRR
jgi:hypothetical protein